jgi:hypothetical protein
MAETCGNELIDIGMLPKCDGSDVGDDGISGGTAVGDGAALP